MNKAVILLSTVSLALLATLVLRSQRAGAQLESAQREMSSVSNQLSEAQIKVNHQERMNAALQTRLGEREAGLAGLSNSVAQLRATLGQVRAELELARAEIPPAIARGEGFAAERDGFSNRVSEIAALLHEQAKQLREARERTVAVQSELAALSHRLAGEQAERTRLENLLTDPAALQARLAEARRAPAATEKAMSSRKPDYHLPLQLEADGSVVLAPVAKTSGN